MRIAASCLLTLRDEYKALGLGEDAAKVASQALLFEEFIAREHTSQDLEPQAQAFGQAGPGTRPLPSESRGRDEVHAQGVEADSRSAI